MDRARAFLGQRRIAVVGVSRDPKDFSRLVFAELAKRGLDVVPVNPAVPEVDGRRCFARLQEVTPPVDGALLLTRPDQSEKVVMDAVESGIRRIWMHRGAGSPGAASARALALCKANGIEAVTDLCPFMVLPHAAFFPHGMHGAFRRAFGRPRVAR